MGSAAFVTPPPLVTTSSSRHRQHLPPLPSGFIGTLRTVFVTTRLQMLESTGLDAYMFVRMISMCFRVCAVLWLLAMLVVLPTNLVGSDEEDSFAAVSITSVGEGSNLMWVHTCVVYVVYGVALFMVYKLYLEVRATLRFLCCE